LYMTYQIACGKKTAGRTRDGMSSASGISEVYSLGLGQSDLVFGALICDY
jgi:hypothetical protein